VGYNRCVYQESRKSGSSQGWQPPTERKRWSMGWTELIGAPFGDDEHRYIIEAEIARGGMSRVFRAREVGTNRVLALKVMALGSEGGGDTRSFTRRFVHEARAVELLDHPNIVKVYATGRTDEFVFIAMQLVLGGTFRQRLGRPMPVADACFQMIQMARALHHAHAHQVIHRDVKPANMLIDDQDPSHLLLADFGIAKIIGQEGVTKTGTAVGTPEYMAPEQAKGEKIDQRADIYGLACVLYEALAGRPPFVGPTALSICYQHVHTRPAYIRGFNPEVPRALALVIEQALAKNPRDRFPTAEDFANALYPFTEGTGRGIRPTTPSLSLKTHEEDEELIDASDGGTNDVEALVTAAPTPQASAQVASDEAEAANLLDLSMLGTRASQAVNVPEDATMVQTQEMVPISQPSRPRHTRPVQPGLRLKSRPTSHALGESNSYPLSYDPSDPARLSTIQTPVTPYDAIKSSPPRGPASSFTGKFPQIPRRRLAIVIVAALVAALLTLLLLSHLHAPTATGSTPPTGTSSALGGSTPAATLAPTSSPATHATATPATHPTVAPTQPVIGGQPTPPPNVNSALAVTVTANSQDDSCSSSFARKTIPAGENVYVNFCLTAPPSGYGTAVIQATLYSDGQSTHIEGHWDDLNGITGSGFADLETPPIGNYTVIVTWNGYQVRTLPLTIQ
jgi:serine/threonine protein kinase